MPDFVAQLQGLDLAAIDDSLGRVRTALEQAQALGTDGLDVTVLLGPDLAGVIEQVGALGNDPDAVGRLGRAAVQALGTLIELPELDDLDTILTGVGELVELIGQIAAVLATEGADGKEILDRILTGVGGSLALDDLLADLTTRAAGALGVDIPDALTAPLNALTRLGTRGGITAADLVDILGALFVGADLGALSTVGASGQAVLRLVGGAGDPLRLEGAITAVTARLDAAYELMLPGAALDVDALVGACADVGAALDTVSAEVDRFAAGLATDLRTAANALAELDLAGRLPALVAELPVPGEDIPRAMVDSLEALAVAFEEMTGAALTEALGTAEQRLVDAIGSGPIGDLLAGLDAAFAELGRLVDALPLRRARDTLIGALAAAQQEILAFDGFGFLDDLLAPVRELEARVRGLDLAAVTGAVQAVVDQVDDVFSDFPVDELRDAVDAVIDPLGAILDELTPVVLGVADELEALVAELEEIDFDAAGTATLDLLKGIREQVTAAVDGGDVPEAVKVVVAGAAAVLAELDLAAELTAPFDEAILTIDADALVAPIEDVWQAAGDTLRRATPAALVAELDPPFEDLLERLRGLGVEPLVRALSELFDDLLSHLQALDPRELVAPLEAEFQGLLTRLRALLDPAPLFAPLREAFAALRGLLDAIDIEAAVHGALGGILDVPGALSASVGEQLASGAPAAAVAGATGEFRFGDVLRPMALFVQEIRGRLEGLADDVLGPALTELARITRGVWAVVDPAAGLAVGLADALDARLALADPRSGTGPLAELRTRVESLAAAVGRLEVDAAARVRLDAATVRFDARVSLDASVSAELSATSGRLRSGSGGAELGRSTRLLARSLAAVLPPDLRDAGADPATAVGPFLDALFARVDVTPLADRLDAIGDRLQARLVELADELTMGIFRVWTAIFTSVEPLMPASLIARVQAGIDSVFARLDVLDPAAVEEEARNVIGALVSLLGVHSPAALARDLGAVFDAALDRVRELDPAALLGDLDPFGSLADELEALRPSVVLAPLAERAASFTVALETIASIDLGFVGEIVAEVRATFTTVLDGVETEWNALLAELSGLSGGASVSVG